MTTELNPNIIPFVGLANEYCQALEQAPQSTKATFIDQMLGLLPRLYITARSLPQPIDDTDTFGAQTIIYALTEDQYEAVRQNIAALLGQDDTYLDTLVEDMQYSDTPIAQNISEQLADLYQPLYDMVYSVRESGAENITDQVTETRATFHRWSQPLLAALKVLNSLPPEDEDDD